MNYGRNREKPSWCNDPRIDRKIEKRVLRNNVLAIAVIIIIAIGMLLR